MVASLLSGEQRPRETLSLAFVVSLDSGSTRRGLPAYTATKGTNARHGQVLDQLIELGPVHSRPPDFGRQTRPMASIKKGNRVVNTRECHPPPAIVNGGET